MFGVTQGRLGLNPAATPPDGEPSVDWTGDVDGYNPSPPAPIVVDDTVYYGGTDARIQAFDAETGDRLWRSEETAGDFYASVGHVDGTVYGGSEDSQTVAVDPGSGDVEWRNAYEPPYRPCTESRDSNCGEDELRQREVLTSPCVVDGLVVVGTESGLRAYDAAEGDAVWTYPSDIPETYPGDGDWPAFQALAAADDGTLVTTRGGRDAESIEFLSLSPSGPEATTLGTVSTDIEDVPEQVVSDRATATGVLVANESAFFSVRTHVAILGERGSTIAGTATKHFVERYDLGSGERQFRSEVGGGAAHCALSGRRLFVANGATGKVYCLDAGSGETLWTQETATAVGTVRNRGDFEIPDVRHGSPLVVDDTVYVGGLDGSVYALDAETGDVEWTVDVGDFAIQATPVIANGRIYVVNDENNLVALSA